MAKLMFLDIETTGTDPKRHGVIQISGFIEIDGRQEESFDLYTTLFPGDIISKDALQINGRSVEEIRGFPKQQVAYRKLMQIIEKFINRYDKKDKFFIVGYNSRFDDDFLREWFRKCNDKYYGSYFHWPAIDVANMAALHFIESRESFKDFKLMTVAGVAGIDISEERSHDASFDISITRELFHKLREDKIGKSTD